MRTHREIFTEIYDKNIWGGSGGGSTPENTVEYRALLQKFLKDRNIKTVVDFGCGDWSFSRLIDWYGVQYYGYDIVESVIDRNRKRYSAANINFHSSITINGADLLIIKDVLQHWSNAEIYAFMDRIVDMDFKHILITNTASQEFDDQNIKDGDTRGLCARFLPLKRYKPTVLSTIQTTILSEVILVSK